MQSVAISSKDLHSGIVDGLICVYKKVGETPLETLGRLRAEFPVLEGVPLSYAGRLDPLAEGVLLVLSGSYNKIREDFLRLEKEYEVEVLFGVGTDTGDPLGLVVHTSSELESTLNGKHIPLQEEHVREVLRSFHGTHTFEYPIYSSKTVDGVPLHEWARSGKIDSISIPTNTIKIKHIELLSLNTVSKAELYEAVLNKISKVHGDFRQNEIKESWKLWRGSRQGAQSNTLVGTARDTSGIAYYITHISVHCSSGTYMRTLAEKIAEKCGMNSGIAYKIVRTKIGAYSTADCVL